MRGRPQQIPEDQILDAAALVLLRKGPAATTAEIAREAGVSEGLVFYRYKTKDELLVAVIERQLRPSEALSDLIRDPGSRPVGETLRELVGQILATLRRAFPFVEIARASLDPAAIARAAGRSEATPERLVEVASRYFEAEVARGRLRPLRTSSAARLIVGACIDRNLSEAGPVGRKPLDTDDDFLDGVVDILLHGVLKRRPAGRSG